MRGAGAGRRRRSACRRRPAASRRSSPSRACPVLVSPGRRLAEFLPRTRPAAKLNLARNRAARRGALSHRARQAARASSTHSTELVRLHALRWQARGDPGVLADARVAAFHRDALPRLDRAGLLRLYLLRFDGADGSRLLRLRASRPRLIPTSPASTPPSRSKVPGRSSSPTRSRRRSPRAPASSISCAGAGAYKYEWGAADRWNRRRAFRRAAAERCRGRVKRRGATAARRAFARPAGAARAESAPPNVALMQLFAEAAGPSEVEAALACARQALQTADDAARRPWRAWARRWRSSGRTRDHLRR